ncbi:MAG TPA: chemotaxis protein CheB [Nannocystis sp.]
MGASAGGLAALSEVLRGLPGSFRAAIFIVVHTSPDNPGLLPQILARSSALPVAFARDHEPIQPGRVYVAPPDHHLLLKRGYVRVVRGPKENGFRPAVDPMFRTAAHTHGARTIGVVLSGGLNDGTHGLAQIVESGGVALAQDPQDALIPSMPLSAIQNVEVRRVLRAVDIPAALIDLVGEAPSRRPPLPDETPDIAEAGDSLQIHTPPGTPAPYTCPECGGALWETSDTGKLLRYRCHVGHAYTAEILAAEQEHNLEMALWTALRALEENAALCRRMAERTASSGFAELARRYHTDADHSEERAALLRKVLQSGAVIAMPRPIDAVAELSPP